MHAAVCNNLQPDFTLLLLPPLEAALTRARRRNHRYAAAQSQPQPLPESQPESQFTDESRFERESIDFYTRIHAAYLQIAAREPQRVLIVANDEGGDNSIDAIELRIRALVAPRLL